MQIIFQDIRRANFVPKSSSWSISGSFKRVDNTNIWLYQHSSYSISSSVDFSNFSSVLFIEQKKAEYPLCPHKDHDHFKVYFEDNLSLMEYLEQTSNDEEQAKLQMLQRLKDVFNAKDASNTPFETPGLPNQRGTQFSENAWTKRLAVALQERLLEFGLTVTFTGNEGLNFDTFQSKRSTLPCTSEVISSYLFHGTADILIDDNAVVDVEMEEETEEGHYVNDNRVIDCGKQALGLKTEFPEKLGELVANMHIASVQKVMKSLKEDRIQQRVIETKGLFLHKAVCGLTCSLIIPMFKVGAEELPQESTKIIIDELYSKSLEPSSLCHYIQKLLHLPLHS